MKWDWFLFSFFISLQQYLIITFCSKDSHQNARILHLSTHMLTFTFYLFQEWTTAFQSVAATVISTNKEAFIRLCKGCATSKMHFGSIIPRPLQNYANILTLYTYIFTHQIHIIVNVWTCMYVLI